MGIDIIVNVPNFGAEILSMGEHVFQRTTDHIYLHANAKLMGSDPD